MNVPGNLTTKVPMSSSGDGTAMRPERGKLAHTSANARPL